ncbi:TMEM43 family protein [Stieleria sp. TO1_6]|uniref:TMEM43 family protein n=1 Tax=Stieleria tagensis TaxID=2956795 RepID=UPI00209B94FA|nr:TMEM43 family protein [Stieleria tagensis]MCO8122125.1 TMEM43 family protein [Stieleria tagensis]
MGTYVSEQSWFGRIGGAIKGILFGGLLILVSVPLLFWNEGRAVRTAKGLKEGAKVVIDIQPDQIDPANEGKLVHAGGTVQTGDLLRDEAFGLEYNGIRLTRHVEMYQWVEDKQTDREKKLGGGTRTTTTYSYHKDWAPGVISSDGFDEAATHQNPTQALFSKRVQQAQDVNLGQFRLPDSLINMISGNESVELDESNVPAEYARAASIRKDGPGGQSRIYLSANLAPPQSGLSGGNSQRFDPAVTKQQDGEKKPLFELVDPEVGTPNSLMTEGSIGAEPSPSGAPQIGDTRIWFTATPVQTVSLMSQQSGETFSPYQTKFGTTINVLRDGTLSAAEMIAQEVSANRVMTWMLRGGGSLVMFIGLSMLLRPLVVLADVLPIAGSLVGFGTAIVAGLLTIAGALTVIGIAWIFYRPLLGISLLAVAAVALYLIYKRNRAKRGSQPEMLTDMDLA